MSFIIIFNICKLQLKLKFDIFTMENLSNFNFNPILMSIQTQPKKQVSISELYQISSNNELYESSFFQGN
jgi:hypothetical protein